MFESDLFLAFTILPGFLSGIAVAIFIASRRRSSAKRPSARSVKKLMGLLVIASFYHASDVRAHDEACFDCEAPPAADINACTFGDNADIFYLGKPGRGTRYDPFNDLYYGFALKDVSPAPFRSDYSSDDEGTFMNPLSVTDCFLYPLDETFQWVEGCLSHGAAREWNYPGMSRINYTGGENFWVMSINNEDLSGPDDSWEDPVKDSFHACNEGPPNLSFRPNQGSTYVGGDGYNFDLSLDLKAFHSSDKQVSCGEYSAPFFGFGAQCKRGNPHPVAYIDTDKSKRIPSVLKFRSMVSDYQKESLAIIYHLMIIAEWKGMDSMGKGRMMDRMIFLDLTHPQARPEVEAPITEHLFGEDWVWPAKNSFYFPGADLAFLESGEMPDLSSCSESLREITELKENQGMREYAINLSELFKCADDNKLFRDKMPRNKTLAVKGIHWVIEGVGAEGELSVNIQDMDIVYNESRQILAGANEDCSDDRTEFISNGSSVNVNFCLHGLSPGREQTLFWGSAGTHACSEETSFENLGPDWKYEEGQWRTTIPLSSHYLRDVTICTVDSQTGQINSRHFKIREERPELYINSQMSCDSTTQAVESKGDNVTLYICARGLPLEKDRNAAMGYAQVSEPLRLKTPGRKKNDPEKDAEPKCDLLPLAQFTPLGNDWTPVNDMGIAKTRVTLFQRNQRR